MDTAENAKFVPSPYVRAWRAFVREMKNQEVYKEDKARFRRAIFKWSWRRFVYFAAIAGTCYFATWLIGLVKGDPFFALLAGYLGSHYCIEGNWPAIDPKNQSN